MIGERDGNQTTRALLALRDLLLQGELPAGERLSELVLVERLGVSRTPVRAALSRLADEGLVEPIMSGGYAVKAFSAREVAEAIEIRGTLEGLAVRLAAERGVTAQALAPLKRCLTDLDQVIAVLDSAPDAFTRYVALNQHFHELLIGLAGSAALTRQLERATALPFASPSAFVMAQSTLPEARTILIVAQDQHRAVIDAIERREGARAESIMREHSRVAGRNLALALDSRRALDMVPGAALIRLRAS